MSVARRALAIIAGLGLLMAGCSAAARLHALQPPSPPSSPRLAVPPRALPWTRMQLGIAIDAYTYPGQDIAAAAAADIGYIRSLHANAVAISFPFFMNGPRAAGVHGSSATPTPAQLAVIVNDAQDAGLYVAIRPLLDETSLGRSRVRWKPADPAAWFASYQRFLMPYAAMAQRQHVNELIIGTELTRFMTSPRWTVLGAALRREYHGRLGCSNSGHPVPGACGPGVSETVDSYRPEQPPVTPGWKGYDHLLGRGTVQTEVGIDAVPGAYQHPYKHHWPGAALDPQMQALWFTAACHAAAADHLGGIYFWSLGFSAQISGPTLAQQGYWADSAGGRAISRCFTSITKAAR